MVDESGAGAQADRAATQCSASLSDTTGARQEVQVVCLGSTRAGYSMASGWSSRHLAQAACESPSVVLAAAAIMSGAFSNAPFADTFSLPHSLSV